MILYNKMKYVFLMTLFVGAISSSRDLFCHEDGSLTAVTHVVGFDNKTPGFTLNQVNEKNIQRHVERISKTLKLHNLIYIGMVSAQIGQGAYLLYSLGSWLTAKPSVPQASTTSAQPAPRQTWGEWAGSFPGWISDGQTWRNGITSCAHTMSYIALVDGTSRLVATANHSHTIRWFVCDGAHYVYGFQNTRPYKIFLADRSELQDGKKNVAQKCIYSETIEKLKKNAATIETAHQIDVAQSQQFIVLANLFIGDIEKIAAFITYKRRFIAPEKRVYVNAIVQKLIQAGNQFATSLVDAIVSPQISGSALFALVDEVARQVNNQIEYFELLDDDKPVESSSELGYCA